MPAQEHPIQEKVIRFEDCILWSFTLTLLKKELNRMNRTQFPTCRRYLSGNQKPNMLYSQAILNHQLEPSAESAKAFHALMFSDGIIEQGSPLPEQIQCDLRNYLY